MQELIKYFETLEARIVALDTRLAALEESKQTAEERIAALETEKERFEARIAELEARPYVELDEDDFIEEEVEEEFVEEEPEAAEEPTPIVEEPVKEEFVKEEPAEQPMPMPTPEPEPQPELFAEEPIKEEPKAEETAPVQEEPAKEEPAAPKAVLYGKPVDDIRLAISLGDRFLYQRELFNQNAELMQRTLTELNELHSFDEAIAYISSRFQWDSESNTYQQFLVTLHRRFG